MHGDKSVMDQVDYFKIFRSMIPLKGKTVLEIGGSVPPSLVASASVALWEAIDINPNRFAESLGSENLPSWYKTHIMDASKMSFDDCHFDIVYSTNCFEHINDLESTLKHINRVLKSGGLLFALFSPIWSGPVGHHTWVWDNDTPLTFSDNVFPDWYHLILSKEELRPILKNKYRPEIVESIINYVYESNDINRLIDRDYENILAQYPFIHLVNMTIKSGLRPDPNIIQKLGISYPDVINYQTLGYFWILAKDRCTIKTKLRMYVYGGMQILFRKKILPFIKRLLHKPTFRHPERSEE